MIESKTKLGATEGCAASPGYPALLPCPFCGLTDTISPDMGETPAVSMHSYPGGYRVECEGCVCMGPWHHQHIDALAAWNRRQDND